MNQSQYTVQDKKEGQFDLLLLWHVFLGNFWKIVAVGLLVAALLGSTRYFTPYQYTTDVSFLVWGLKTGWSKDDNGQDQFVAIANDQNGATVGAQFALNAPYIIGGDHTINSVIDYMKQNFPDEYRYEVAKPPVDGAETIPDERVLITNKTIKRMLSVSVNEQHVKVAVTHEDPVVVMHVCRAFEHVVPGQMDYFFGLDNVTLKEGEYENVQSVAKALNTTITDPQDAERLSRRTLIFAMIGFILGAGAVFTICFMRAYLDNTIYSEDDLKNYFTLPVVGQIPDWDNAETDSGYSSYGGYGSTSYAGGNTGEGEKKKKKTKKKAKKKADVQSDRSDYQSGSGSTRDYTGRLLTKDTPFAITEAFKSLRTNMCYTTKGEKCAVYGITSAYVKAGKSLVIANLAVSFSMMDKKVLLLDGDLRCPVQHRVFNLSNHVHGFSDVLAGICTYENMDIRDGGYPNLSILTCGKLPPNPAELLASENMKQFLERAKQDYDFIFIDLPPVSEVSDAGILSELITGFAFVVRAGYSDRRMVEMTLEAMEGFEAPLTGFILNDVDIKSGRYYKSKYYKGYGKYGKYSKYGYKKYGKYGYSKYGYKSYGKYGGRYGGYGSGYGEYSRSADAVRESMDTPDIPSNPNDTAD